MRIILVAFYFICFHFCFSQNNIDTAIENNFSKSKSHSDKNEPLEKFIVPHKKYAVEQIEVKPEHTKVDIPISSLEYKELTENSEIFKGEDVRKHIQELKNETRQRNLLYGGVVLIIVIVVFSFVKYSKKMEVINFIKIQKENSKSEIGLKDVAIELEKINELKIKGVISKEEFIKLKERIIK